MITIDFSKRGDAGLCDFLFSSIRSQISAGLLKADEKLPSKRALASHLGVSVITVQNAYEQLIDEGYIYSIEKKGFFVTEIAPDGAPGDYVATAPSNAGIKLAVATASSEELYLPALRRCGIADMFEAFATVDECGRKKGFPDVYELACRRMDAGVSGTVVFEDIYIAICGAADGGFRTAAVYDSTSARDTEKIKAKADAYITSFTELL